MSKLRRLIKKYQLDGPIKRGISIIGYPNFGKKTEIRAKEKGQVIIKKRVTISSYTHLASVGGCLSVGENVFLNRGCIIVCREDITIKDNCIFGPNVCIYDHDHSFNYNGIQDEYKTAPVIIEEGCWIGAGTIILRGSHIGEGCIIGAGTVIKGRIPAHTVVMSNRELIIRPIRQE